MSRPKTVRGPDAPAPPASSAPRETNAPDAIAPLAAPAATATRGEGHVISEELSGVLLDAAVRALFDVSWGKARAWIDEGKITLDGAVVRDATRRVRKGSPLVRNMAARRVRDEDARGLSRDAVVHVDAHVVVVDKPSGVSTVPFDASLPGGGGGPAARAGKPRSGETEEGTTLDALVRDYLARTQKLSARAGGRAPLGVVHRIDKETSGLVVFTRTWQAKQSLTSQFRAHTTHRRYFALVHGAAESRTYRTNLIADRGDGVRGSLEALRGRGGRGLGEGQLAITHVE
ncbi:hypothetical protein EON77_04425, partial [bacterium]